MRAFYTVLLLVLLTHGSSAQNDRPALITRKQFAESNLLFSSQRDVKAGFTVVQSCIRIQPDGFFHRETSEQPSKPKYAEVGKLTAAELADLKAMLDDPEFKTYFQNPENAPHVITMEVGYQMFAVSIYRPTKDRPQELFFVNTDRSTAEPPKVQTLQKFLHELETRKDPTLEKVQADGCKAHVNPAPENKQ